MAAARSSTAGYAEEAAALIEQYERISFAEAHRQILPLIPTAPSHVLDIGAGTGRDAAALASMGHAVLAVEPTDELRHAAASLHPMPHIEWLDDSLPLLLRVTQRRLKFDLILLSAVWMHLDKRQRRRAMPCVAALLAPGGSMIMTLRHGLVPRGRRMFDVSAVETIGLAAAQGLVVALHADRQDGAQRRPGVSWTRLAFRKPRE
jgi:protein-L-isoaspartate O-methyltransferase